MLWLIIYQISIATGDGFTLTPSLGVIPCEYRHKWYIPKYQLLWVIFHSENMLVHL